MNDNGETPHVILSLDEYEEYLEVLQDADDLNLIEDIPNDETLTLAEADERAADGRLLPLN